MIKFDKQKALEEFIESGALATNQCPNYLRDAYFRAGFNACMEQANELIYTLKQDYTHKLGYLQSNKYTDNTSISIELNRLEHQQIIDSLKYQLERYESPYNVTISSSEYAILLDKDRQLKEAERALSLYANRYNVYNPDYDVEQDIYFDEQDQLSYYGKQAKEYFDKKGEENE